MFDNSVFPLPNTVPQLRFYENVSGVKSQVGKYDICNNIDVWKFYKTAVLSSSWFLQVQTTLLL